MKIIDPNNHLQIESILNECKGNLFEFLVAQNLSKAYDLEASFLISITPEFKNKLKEYEELIRRHDPQLLLQLSNLAKQTAVEIQKSPYLGHVRIKEWMVIGKIKATNDNDLWSETDIIGITSDEKKIYLSLKLSKDNSYTNTKSAGAKSFLVKYFKECPSCIEFQNMFNNEVDVSFLRMGNSLYEMIDAQFKGAFDSIWKNNYSELPGELPPEFRVVVFENYYRLSLLLNKILNNLINENRKEFVLGLKRLCGFSDENIIQVNCFHQQNELKEISIKNVFDYFNVSDEEICILPLLSEKASVDIQIGKLVLQMRIKPMNKFTTASYKINCSIKEFSI